MSPFVAKEPRQKESTGGKEQPPTIPARTGPPAGLPQTAARSAEPGEAQAALRLLRDPAGQARARQRDRDAKGPEREVTYSAGRRVPEVLRCRQPQGTAGARGPGSADPDRHAVRQQRVASRAPGAVRDHAELDRARAVLRENKIEPSVIKVNEPLQALNAPMLPDRQERRCDPQTLRLVALSHCSRRWPALRRRSMPMPDKEYKLINPPQKPADREEDRGHRVLLLCLPALRRFRGAAAGLAQAQAQGRGLQGRAGGVPRQLEGAWPSSTTRWRRWGWWTSTMTRSSTPSTRTGSSCSTDQAVIKWARPAGDRRRQVQPGLRLLRRRRQVQRCRGHGPGLWRAVHTRARGQRQVLHRPVDGDRPGRRASTCCASSGWWTSSSAWNASAAPEAPAAGKAKG